ncbi:MAG: exosortase H [Candidatus Thiodiazotropha taylori]|nr:exosortase H [Candidatus Thiodiazotropha taylori]MCG8016084.1 exosortase H [Candidatus Thiodiazotropha sp. 'RUGA']RLW53254.1 MAG: exosortase H [gamma proteobacterium symbiont of Stewartia floridana]MCG7868222.1 exosortase H [Candidatus Thiodiazotropha taylori]MCG7906465.1 exosortase H [Candidatus Thiodiazotropha taylori]
MLRFALLFSAILIGLFTLELMPFGQQWVVIPFTAFIAEVSAWLIQLFDHGVHSYGIVLLDKASGFAVSIEAGCNGIEASIVLIAAMLAFPASWRMKLIGIGVGILAIQAMNLLRIISLFYLGQWNQTAFEWAHLYIWQSLIILDVLVVFLIWLRYLPRVKPHSGPEHASA